MGYRSSIGNRDKNEQFIRDIITAIGGYSIQLPPGAGADLVVVWGGGVHLVEIKRNDYARQNEVTDSEAGLRDNLAEAGYSLPFVVRPLELLRLIGFEFPQADINTLLQMQDVLNDKRHRQAEYVGKKRFDLVVSNWIMANNFGGDNGD